MSTDPNTWINTIEVITGPRPVLPQRLIEWFPSWVNLDWNSIHFYGFRSQVRGYLRPEQLKALNDSEDNGDIITYTASFGE